MSAAKPRLKTVENVKAGLFGHVAQSETGHAFHPLDFRQDQGDPATGVKVGTTAERIHSLMEGEIYDYTEIYPGFSRMACEHGRKEIAEGERRNLPCPRRTRV